MNLRKRTLITLAVSLLLLVAVLYVISQNLLMGNLTEVQVDSTQKDLETVNDLLFRDLDDLSAIDKQWAMLGEDSFYDKTSQTFNPDALRIFNSTGIDLVIVSSSMDGTVYFKSLNDSENLNDSQTSSSHQDELESYLSQNSFIKSENLSNPFQGILLLPSGTYLISSSPITGSEGNNLILGRYLEIPQNGHLSKIPGLSLNITPFNNGEMVPTFHDVSRDFSYGSPVIIKPVENNTISGYSLLRDGEGRAVFQMKLSENPYIIDKGQETLIYFIFSFLVTGIILGFITLLFLDKIVLSRINDLNNRVQEITKTNDISRRLPVNGSNDEISGLSHGINSLLISLQSSWEEIQQSRKKYRNIFYNTGTAMISTEGDGVISLINSEFENLSGFKKVQVEGIKSWKDFFPEDIKKMTKYSKIRKLNEHLAPRNYEARFLGREGSLKDVYLTVTTVPGTDQFLLSLMDITPLKQSLEEKDALLREVHHRVKNNMQIMISLLNMKARHTSDEEVKSILMESQDRIKSMAMVHDGLYHSPDMIHINLGNYIQRLTTELFRSYGVDSNLIKLVVNVDAVSISIDTAVPCGLLLNELVSNSIKHAFDPSEKGEIRICLSSDEDLSFENLYSPEDSSSPEVQGSSKDSSSLTDERSPPELTLTVWDNGKGLADGFDISKSDTMGMKLIDALVTQLEAKIEFNNSPGACFKIKFKELNYSKRI
ncbi:histidine kinase dimerization/phosphoacceptor domain -containing protein [Methanobacterium formicicum]|uniref:histidine kinase n=1 Tax=Methanobacterium formicicum (strain DSM 3637 / PP1) TaxID=1204725 RepID=K2QCX8_METFP|nr:histidine kinase dimerization/phosphoacceptor domain -containing protein [Methanobacterium formicicum]EKF85841.1 signal transduction histidine kinase [Methanobacterium formicicum DSM 3637]